MTKAINSVEAARIEAEGRGSFRVVGRSLVLRTNDGVEYRWGCASEREAKDHLRLFRASLKWAA